MKKALARGERIHESPGPVGHIGMQFLLAALHVITQPRRANGGTAQIHLRPVAQLAEELSVNGAGKKVLGGRAKVRVLIWHVPEIPHEPIGSRLLWICESTIKFRAQRFARGRKAIYHPTVLLHPPLLS